jgi:hypothetical protein
MITDTQKSFQPGKKDIKYLNRDFAQLRETLVDFTKYYYPNTYKDFNNASTGILFIEMASYVGDILSYYTDYQFKESLLVNAEERKNIIALSRFLGYKPKVVTPSVTELDVYQLVPSITEVDGTFVPDLKFAQVIKPGMVTTSETGINFVTNEPVDFTVDTPNNPLEISVYQRNGAGQPEFYVLKKKVTAYSGTILTETVSVGSPQPFFKIELNNANVVEILDIYDSDGNRWYETDYLAQDLVAIDIENVFKNDNEFYENRDTVPFILKFLRTSRRFTSYIDENNFTILEFGSGIDIRDDDLIVPNAQVISQKSFFSNGGVAYDPKNFLQTKTYGQAPANTTLTIRYVAGGGEGSNVNAESINTVAAVDFFGDISELNVNDQRVARVIRSSLKVNNTIPAVGGAGPETNDDIRNNALASFSAQNRAVTREDYIVRAYSMPAKHGSVAKAYVSTETELSENEIGLNSMEENPYAINLYVLSYNSKKELIPTTPALRHNLKNYMNQYRMLTDAINIVDGFIINIGVEFGVVSYKNYNKRDVLNNCLEVVQEYFNIDNIQFSQPINLSRLELEIAKIDGVQSVSYVRIKNLTTKDGENYSQYEYNIEAATRNNVVYPSIDPSVFEVKYPSKDIVGKCF